MFFYGFKKKFLFCLALFFAISNSNVYGAEKEEDGQVKEIVVSATRTEKDVFEVASSVSTVSKEELAREPKATIAEALQDIPGVQVYSQGMGGGAKRISIRGEKGSRVLVLIDGMKISEQKSLEGASFMLDTNSVERIEVVKGPASVLYGSEAIGGVINIITKKGGTKPVQFGMSFTYDSAYESIKPYATIFGKIKGFSYRFSGDVVNAHNKRGASGVIDNSSYWQNNFSAYMDYEWDKLKIGGGYDYYRTRINLPVVKTRGVTVRRGTEIGATTYVDLDLPNWQREKYYGFIELKDLSETVQKVSLQSFISDVKKDFKNAVTVDIDRIQMGPRNWLKQEILTDVTITNSQRSYGNILQADLVFDDHYVVVGFDQLRDTLKADEIRDSYRVVTSSIASISGVFPSDTNGKYAYKGHQDTYAVFAQDEWSISDDWTLSFGGRGTWIGSELEENTAGLKNETSTGKNLSLSAGIVYSGLEDWAFRGQYSQGYRFPTLQELYIGTPHGGSGITKANPDLSPEKSQNFEVGARYSANSFDADVAVYHTIAKDYIFRRKISGSDDGMYANANRAYTTGVEAELAYTIEDINLTPYVQGTWMQRKYETPTYSTRKTGLPPISGRVGLRYSEEIAKNTNLNADVYGRFNSKAKNLSVANNGNKNVNTYDSWETLNLSVGVTTGDEYKYFVDVNLNNILNKKYTLNEGSGLEEPGFNVVIRTGFEF